MIAVNQKQKVRELGYEKEHRGRVKLGSTHDCRTNQKESFHEQKQRAFLKLLPNLHDFKYRELRVFEKILPPKNNQMFSPDLPSPLPWLQLITLLV
jgi:hypothetical protein